jgi:hypothetical protein
MFTHTHCNRSREILTHNLCKLAACFACTGLISTASTHATVFNYHSAEKLTVSESQSSDLLLKLVIEAMLDLLEDIENTYELPSSMLSQESLGDVAGLLIWGYANMGLRGDLNPSEIAFGISNSEAALTILNDKTVPLSLTAPVRDLLNTVVEEIQDDLETES